jgi:hypothetical protein
MNKAFFIVRFETYYTISYKEIQLYLVRRNSAGFLSLSFDQKVLIS